MYKNKAISRFLLFTVVLSITVYNCAQHHDYYTLEKRELASGERHDSLFLGLYLGMKAKDFYTHCWELNRQGICRQGASNTSVYKEITSFKHPAGMEFYPRFHNDHIVEMPLVFSYDAWAPWNRDLFSDHLLEDVLDLLKEWYGEGFISIENPKDPNTTAHVKIDGNRRISAYVVGDNKVKVDIIDLRLLRKLEQTK